MKRNDPNDSRKYNYVYKITNIINNKIYIGVHRTDNLDDKYMGSGTNIKRAIDKYGLKNFKKDIIMMYDTYRDALNHEAKIVTEGFINRDDTYNIRVGGRGPCVFSEKHKQHLSESRKDKYKNDHEFAEKMKTACKHPERRQKIGNKVRRWIQDNLEDHASRMHKINLNPEKIKKTADWHRGQKRSEEACNNIRQGIKDSLRDPDVRKRRSGEGCVYYYCIVTGQSKRFQANDIIPSGWSRGTGPRKKTDDG